MAIGVVNGLVSASLNVLFKKMESRIRPDPAQQTGTLNQVEAYNAFNMVKNEDPNLIEMLPSYVKDKFANGGLTMDLFNQLDPLGVQDGLINFEEFAKGLNPVGSSIDTGNGERGDATGYVTKSGYTVWNSGEKKNAQITAQNIIGDFENILQGQPGSIVNGNVNKAELGIVISKYRAAGQNDRASVAQWMLDGYDLAKNSNNDIDVESLAASFRKFPETGWE